MKFDEINGSITGVKDELHGEVNSFRDTVQTAFAENKKLLRGEISKAKDIIVQDLVDQLKLYNTEVKEMLDTNKKVVENGLHEKDKQTHEHQQLN